MRRSQGTTLSAVSQAPASDRHGHQRRAADDPGRTARRSPSTACPTDRCSCWPMRRRASRARVAKVGSFSAGAERCALLHQALMLLALSLDRHRQWLLQAQYLDDRRRTLRARRSAARRRLHHLLHAGINVGSILGTDLLLPVPGRSRRLVGGLRLDRVDRAADRLSLMTVFDGGRLAGLSARSPVQWAGSRSRDADLRARALPRPRSSGWSSTM